MLNDKKIARKSIIALQRLTKHQLEEYEVNYKLSYNHNENPVELILELARQKLLDDYSSILLWIAGIAEAPEWFEEALESIVVSYDVFNYVIDSDLQRHVSDYTRDIERCRKVVLVAHSQGNFYGNEAWNLVYL
ncbi:MAG: hypothetical protein ACR2PT_01270, partial [Endozoicomonas sp.]